MIVVFVKIPAISHIVSKFYNMISMEKISKKKIKVKIVEDEDILILKKFPFGEWDMRWLRPFLNGEDIIKEINRVTYEIYLIDYRLPCNKNGN